MFTINSCHSFVGKIIVALGLGLIFEEMNVLSCISSNLINSSSLTNEQIIEWKENILSYLPSLRQLFTKWSQRGKKDLKIPPGSQDVVLSFTDPRYVLSTLCIAQSKIKLRERGFDECEALLRESYMWCPKSVETLFLLAEILRIRSTHQIALDDAMSVYRKAIIVAGAITNKDVTGEVDCLVNNASFGKEAACKEALYLLQNSRSCEADSILKAMGFRWRISDKALNYELSDFIKLSPNHTPLVKVFDDFIEQTQLLRLQYIFRSESPFWLEHDYDEFENFSRKVGYFSYLYPFRERCAGNFIEQLIDAIYEVMSKEVPDLIEATTSEWWVHSRPHSCGHQMHFDSDETRIDEGGSPQHPIISCVLFVREAGGPTLMTDQTLLGGLANEGWMIDAKLNRILAFDARYLHGVIPGIGNGTEESSRRLTFMVGFWRKIESKDKGKGRYGAGQPFPFNDESLCWPKEMNIHEALEKIHPNSSNPCNIVRYVCPIWEQLQSGGTNDYKTFFQGF